MKQRRILVLGSSNTDMTVKSNHLPKPGETILGGNFMMGQGGKGANQAVAAKKLGGDVTFICKLGEDIFAENAINHYNSIGLDTSKIIRSQKPSGVALITVDASGENSIVVASGANADITESDIESISHLIEEAEILLVQLEIPIAAVEKAISIASKAGVKVVLNPAPAAQLSESILSNVSIIVPNQHEAEMLSGIEVRDEESASLAARKLQEKGIESVIITMGSHGALVYNGDVTFVPARKVKALDTTAAGDTFCGALCVALAEGKTLVQAVEFATAASSISVQRLGAQDSVPSREEVDYIITN